MIRLLADDLTGALDSAACFVASGGPMHVVWSSAPATGSAAIDTGTRDRDEAAAVAAVETHRHALAGADIAFKKVDSLLRGHVAAELAVCMRGFDHCIFAPAFPFQGRVTRAGRQWMRDGTGWSDVGVDLSGLPVLDAETDDDLDAIVATGRRLSGRVLWCGSAGLAAALARCLIGHEPPVAPILPQPVLALIGSHHAATLTQLARIPRLHRRLPPDGLGGDRDGAWVAVPGHAHITGGWTGPGALTVDIPAGIAPDRAAPIIAKTFLTGMRHAARPGTLFVSGGETLRALCEGLAATSLVVDGALEPGVPTSVLHGGAWDGQRIVSKSGAFGDAGFLQRLLTGQAGG